MLNNLALALKEDTEPLNLAELTDKVLASEFLSGRSKAFDEITRRYDTKIYRLALRITKNPRDAEDIRQNVFLALLNKIGTFKGRSSFSSWLYKVAINECYMYLRRIKKYKNWVHFKESSNSLIEKDFVFSRGTPDDSVFLREACEKVEGILSHMNERQRTVFLLVDREELNVREVAKILGISVSCVKSRLLRARYFLRNTMSKELGINYRFKPNGQD